MMRTILTAMILAGSLTTVFADNVRTIAFREYLDGYLEQSATLDAAVEAAEDAFDAYEDAEASGESAYELGLIESTYRYREALVLRVLNEETIAAVELVHNEAASRASRDFTATSESLAEEEYARTVELHANEYVSARDLLTARAAKLQAAAGARSAAAAHAAALRALARPVDETPDSLRIVMFDIPEELPDLPELGWIVDHDADVIHLRADLDLYRRRREHIRESEIILPAEQESLQQAIENAERSLQERIWQLEDALVQIRADIASHPQSLTAAETNERIAALDLEEARYQLAQGDLHSTGVRQVELAHAMAAEQLADLARTWLLTVLDLLKLMNEDLQEWAEEL